MVKEFKKFDGDLQITTNCPIDCDFCVYSCTMDGGWMPEETMHKVAREYTKNDFGIRVCGGEPFLDFKKLEKCLDIVLEYQKPHEIQVITSGFFGVSEKRCSEALQILSSRKMDTLIISSDRFHLGKVPYDAIVLAVKECRKQNIQPIVRITIDDESKEYIERITKIIAELEFEIELHDEYGIYGRAEVLGTCDLNKAGERHALFISSLKKEMSERGNEDTFDSLFVQSPKRSQWEYASRFYPTAFPNGDVFADSQSCKATLMGNINSQSLGEMIEKYKETLPGYVLLSKDRWCSTTLRAFLPPQSQGDYCDYCRNHPLDKKIAKDAIGREFVSLKMGDNFDVFLSNAKKSKRELLIRFELEETDLNRDSGSKILSLLQKLKEEKIRFVVSRALPRCLFGNNFISVTKKYSFPKDCFECNEMFSVEKGIFKSCSPVGIDGPKLGEVTDREEVHSVLKREREKSAPCETCAKCAYYKRKLCDGLCFRNYPKQEPVSENIKSGISSNQDKISLPVLSI